MNIIYFFLISAFIIAIVSWFIVMVTFRNYYSGMGLTIIIAYALIVSYTVLELFIFLADSIVIANNISKISTIVLVTGLYLLHYFHDEISAEYRQRKTMVIASLIWGMNVGVTLIDGSIKIRDDPFVPVLHPLFGLLITGQSVLLIHRITSHNITMGNLSNHYGIKEKVPARYREYLQRILYVFLFFTALSYIIIDNQASTASTVIIPVGGLFLALLYNRDPLSSLPIAQPIEAIALIREDKVRFLHVLDSTGESVVKQENFGILMITLSKFFKEMMKSETKIRSISTHDVLVMFEISGKDYIVLILKRRAPLIRKILKLVVTEIGLNNPQDDISFSNLINKYLLFRPTK